MGEMTDSHLKNTRNMLGRNGHKKIARITNGRFSWVLEVDGENILFQGHSSAEYFLNHYRKLGYVIEIDDSSGFLEEGDDL